MRISFPKAWRREAGDTLIEVTMALSILSMVLISSTVIATQAYRSGQTARERTTLAIASEGQLESVRAFRDNNSWDHFLSGDVLPPIPPGGKKADARPYRGILNAGLSKSCHVISPCMHMEPSQAATFLPQDGTMDGPVNTSYIEISARALDPGANPNNIEVTINYGFEGLGSGNFTGHIKTNFTNLQAQPGATPVPVVLPCNAGITDIVLVIDTSSSMRADWDSGLTRFQEAVKVANQFIDAASINAVGNHMALISFNDTATTLSDLTGSVPALHGAVAKMVTIPGTKYLEALKAADSEFKKNGRPGVNKALVFMSDGQDGDNGYTQSLNAPIVHAGIDKLPPNTAVYTIGINPDGLDMSLLQNMPRNGGFYADAKSTTSLDQAFNNIAGIFTCK